MTENAIENSGHVIALIDVGTNSARLMVVRLNPNNSYVILNQYKVMVKLGEGEFATGRLQPEAIDRTVLVLKRFVEMASNLKAVDYRAVATAATRDADNRNEFVDRVRKEAGLELRVISGLEEARLIYLGVSSGVHLLDRKALFIDIGGGSTETITGNQGEFFTLDSIKVGAIRLKNTFFLEDDEGPVSDERYALLRQYVRNYALRSLQKIREEDIEICFGSSGTIETLYDVYQKRWGSEAGAQGDEEILTLADAVKVITMLRSLPIDERKKVAGMNPDRADIIITGASILHTFMEELGIGEVHISRRSLKNGLLQDYLLTGKYGYLRSEAHLSVREQSVLQLGRTCGFNETHARHVAELALELFDSSRKAGLHALGDRDRELLYYSALLHDVGLFLSFSNHHAHTNYIIKNAELLGFDSREIQIMAASAFYHSKKYPKKKDSQMEGMDRDSIRTVKLLSIFLSLAESLDRSHHQLIRKVSLDMDGSTPVLEVRALEGHEIELWSTEKHQKHFRKLFGENFELKISTVPGKDENDRADFPREEKLSHSRYRLSGFCDKLEKS